MTSIRSRAAAWFDRRPWWAEPFGMWVPFVVLLDLAIGHYRDAWLVASYFVLGILTCHAVSRRRARLERAARMHVEFRCGTCSMAGTLDAPDPFALSNGLDWLHQTHPDHELAWRLHDVSETNRP